MATNYRQLKRELEKQIAGLIKERSGRAVSTAELVGLREQFIAVMPRGAEALLVAKSSGLLRPRNRDFQRGIYGGLFQSDNSDRPVAYPAVLNAFEKVGIITFCDGVWIWAHLQRKSWADVLAVDEQGIKQAFNISAATRVPETLAQLSALLLRRKLSQDFADHLLRRRAERHNEGIRQLAFKTGIEGIRPDVSLERLSQKVIEATTPKPTLAELEAWTERARELEESGLDPDEAVATAERETRQAQVGGLGI